MLSPYVISGSTQVVCPSETEVFPASCCLASRCQTYLLSCEACLLISQESLRLLRMICNRLLSCRYWLLSMSSFHSL